jgi:cytidine deaminase
MCISLLFLRNYWHKVSYYHHYQTFLPANYMYMIRKDIFIHVTETDDMDRLTKEERELIQVSARMTGSAYAPYSGFFVGAAVLLENGEIVRGSNQENAAYPSGLCAERVAVFAASAMFPGVSMKMIAISAKASGEQPASPVAPCGACRQVILEYEELQQKPIRVLLSNESGKVIIIEKAQDLLPLAFSGSSLKRW